MPTVNGDFQNQASVTQSEAFGFKVSLPTITANQVITIDADAEAAPEDGAVVAVDTSQGDVELTINPILPGAEIKVINTGGGVVNFAAGSGVTLSGGSSVNAGPDAVAELRHIKDGNVVMSGDVT